MIGRVSAKKVLVQNGFIKNGSYGYKHLMNMPTWFQRLYFSHIVHITFIKVNYIVFQLLPNRQYVVIFIPGCLKFKIDDFDETKI